jgi:hypothetical protein
LKKQHSMYRTAPHTKKVGLGHFQRDSDLHPNFFCWESILVACRASFVFSDFGAERCQFSIWELHHPIKSQPREFRPCFFRKFCVLGWCPWLIRVFVAVPTYFFDFRNFVPKSALFWYFSMCIYRRILGCWAGFESLYFPVGKIWLSKNIFSWRVWIFLKTFLESSRWAASNEPSFGSVGPLFVEFQLYLCFGNFETQFWAKKIGLSQNFTDLYEMARLTHSMTKNMKMCANIIILWYNLKKVVCRCFWSSTGGRTENSENIGCS